MNVLRSNCGKARGKQCSEPQTRSGEVTWGERCVFKCLFHNKKIKCSPVSAGETNCPTEDRMFPRTRGRWTGPLAKTHGTAVSQTDCAFLRPVKESIFMIFTNPVYFSVFHKLGFL